MTDKRERKKLYPAYIQVKMTEKDKELLESEADRRSITSDDLVRMLIRSLDKSYPTL